MDTNFEIKATYSHGGSMTKTKKLKKKEWFLNLKNWQQFEVPRLSNVSGTTSIAAYMFLSRRGMCNFSVKIKSQIACTSSST